MRITTLFILTLFSIASCEERACTEIGCVNGLVMSFELEETTQVEITFISGQNTSKVECGGVQSNCMNTEVFDDFTVEEMHVKLFNDSMLINEYTQEISYETTRPNGEKCDPECRQASVTISD
jgi:hypothetical protein